MKGRPSTNIRCTVILVDQSSYNDSVSTAWGPSVLPIILIHFFDLLI